MILIKFQLTKQTNFQLVRTSWVTATNQVTGKNLVLFVTRWSHISIVLVVKSDYLNAQIISGKYIIDDFIREGFIRKEQAEKA